MSNKFLIIIVSIVIGFFGIVLVNKKNNAKNTSNNSTAQTSNHFLGNEDSKVVLVEYGDFECPACKQYHPIVKQVVEKYKGEIKFQFRNFPLAKIHQHAIEGSRAAEAASRQGKFWEMHDYLYENQDSWSRQNDPLPAFTSFATQLGLNAEQFKTDYASSEINDIINSDIAEGTKIGANSTPTFVLNGKKVDPNPNSIEAFEKLIEDAIKEAKENKQ